MGKKPPERVPASPAGVWKNNKGGLLRQPPYLRRYAKTCVLQQF